MTNLNAPIQFFGYAPQLTLAAESRTITGDITTFGVPTSDYRQLVIHEGALRPRMPLDRVKLLRDHDQRDPVGYMLSLEGKRASFKVAANESGDRALFEAHPDQKLRDGLSVGIQVLSEDGAYEYDADTQTYHVYAAELVEVSVCAIPAFPDAQITDVQFSAATHASPPPKEKTTMDPATTLTLDAVDQALDARFEKFERVFETRLAAHSAPVPSGPQFASAGDYIKKLAAGDTEAAEFHLAAATGVLGDAPQRNTWLGDAIRLIEKTRKIVNRFTHAPLPEQGNVLEYYKLKSNTVKVEKQENEADNLKTGKVILDSATADVETYGGFVELSLQAIKRSTAPLLDTAHTAMTLAYANATEAVVRAYLYSLITEQITAGNKIGQVANPKSADWLDVIVDGAEIFEDRGFNLEGLQVSKDIFKTLYRLEDKAGNQLMNVYGTGVNVTGELNVKGLSGNLANVPVVLLASAAPKTASFYDPLAITTFESPGAPAQLQDENIINLTKQFSVHGELAVTSQFPGALLPIEFAEGA